MSKLLKWKNILLLGAQIVTKGIVTTEETILILKYDFYAKKLYSKLFQIY